MSNAALAALVDDLARDRRISADEAMRLRQHVFPDGVVSRDEAEALIALEARVSDANAAWSGAFVDAIVDHMLETALNPGHVSAESAQWLMSRFGETGAHETEIETVLKVLERCQSAPTSLCDYARARIAAYVDGRAITAGDVELMRRALYAGDAAVTEAEAHWLFTIDAAHDHFGNAAGWQDLFVKCLLNHVMGRRAPALLDAEGMLARQAWLNNEHKARPVGNLVDMLGGGWSKYLAGVRSLDDTSRLETYYEAANENAEEDAELTLTEVAFLSGLAREDGKRTSNEDALLAEIRRLEAVRA
ncbi:hypothetical protein [Terricaulis sp.]|uniref:hypothetical protein n=1 Tax=Terricaulis sp. TaxID=2768686 RepID=UPI003783B184